MSIGSETPRFTFIPPEKRSVQSLRPVLRPLPYSPPVPRPERFLMAFRALVRLLRWQTPWNEVAPSLRISPRAFGRRGRAERSATVGEAARFSAARARSVWFRCRATSSPPPLETSVAFPMTCPSADGSRCSQSVNVLTVTIRNSWVFDKTVRLDSTRLIRKAMQLEVGVRYMLRPAIFTNVTIVIVEDHPDIRFHVAEFLSRQGAKVIAAPKRLRGIAGGQRKSSKYCLIGYQVAGPGWF